MVLNEKRMNELLVRQKKEESDSFDTMQKILLEEIAKFKQIIKNMKMAHESKNAEPKFAEPKFAEPKPAEPK